MTDINANSIINNPTNTLNSNIVIDTSNINTPLQISNNSNNQSLPIGYTNGIINNSMTNIIQLLQFLSNYNNNLSISQYNIQETINNFQSYPSIPGLNSIYAPVSYTSTIFIDPIYNCQISPSDITPYIGQQSPINNPISITITLPDGTTNTVNAISIMQNGNQLSITDNIGRVINLFLQGS